MGADESTAVARADEAPRSAQLLVVEQCLVEDGRFAFQGHEGIHGLEVSDVDRLERSQIRGDQIIADAERTAPAVVGEH